MLAVGVFLVVTGSRIKRRNKRFRRYVSLISLQNMTSLDNIAAVTTWSVDFVRADIQKMIDKRFFANASIDLANNIVIMCGKAASAQVSAKGQGQAAMEAEIEAFECPGCGAAGKKRRGDHVECEYCGSMI